MDRERDSWREFNREKKGGALYTQESYKTLTLMQREGEMPLFSLCLSFTKSSFYSGKK